jgi:hypothetical protein
MQKYGISMLTDTSSRGNFILTLKISIFRESFELFQLPASPQHREYHENPLLRSITDWNFHSTSQHCDSQHRTNSLFGNNICFYNAKNEGKEETSTNLRAPAHHGFGKCKFLRFCLRDFFYFGKRQRGENFVFINTAVEWTHATWCGKLGWGGMKSWRRERFWGIEKLRVEVGGIEVNVDRKTFRFLFKLQGRRAPWSMSSKISTVAYMSSSRDAKPENPQLVCRIMSMFGNPLTSWFPEASKPTVNRYLNQT